MDLVRHPRAWAGVRARSSENASTAPAAPAPMMQNRSGSTWARPGTRSSQFHGKKCPETWTPPIISDPPPRLHSSSTRQVTAAARTLGSRQNRIAAARPTISSGQPR